MPMSLEFLPEFALLIAGVILFGVALRFLIARRWSRAAGLFAAGLAIVATAFVSGRSDRLHGQSSTWKPLALVPADSSRTGENDADGQSSVSLVLGDVALRVSASNRYVLSLEDEPFLTLDSLASGLLVSCRVARSNGLAAAATISQNAVVYCGSGVEPTRPDRHTIAVQERDEDILRIRYSEPRRIEVVGQFYVSGDRDPNPSIISLLNGIAWRGAVVPSGTSIDLRSQGDGTIRFERSGLIQVLP